MCKLFAYIDVFVLTVDAVGSSRQTILLGNTYWYVRGYRKDLTRAFYILCDRHAQRDRVIVY